MESRVTVRRFILVAVSTILSAGLSEVILRGFSDASYYPWLPNTQQIFRPLPGVMPGVSGQSRFTINSLGIRGDEFSDEQKGYRILAIGGSTTACLYLDDSEAWPHLLQRRLNSGPGDAIPVWVGNVGRGGMNTRHHIHQTRELLSQYPGIDAVMLLIGANDLHLALSDPNYRPYFQNSREDTREVRSAAFPYSPEWDSHFPFYKRTEVWRGLRRIKNRLTGQDEAGRIPIRWANQDEAGRIYIRWRDHRRNATAIRNELPDMSDALEEYARNVSAIVDNAENASVRVIFMTQPALWKSDMSEEEEDLLWLGGIGHFQREIGHEYYSVEALTAAMATYNEVLLSICRERGVECVDLASRLPKDASVFYDDFHFNEGGARQVAEVLAEYLSQNDPLRPHGEAGRSRTAPSGNRSAEAFVTGPQFRPGTCPPGSLDTFSG